MANRKAKAQIKYGKKDLIKAPITPDQVKVLISIRLDGDVLQAVKRAAGSRGYQTLINKTLREAFVQKPSVSARDEIRISFKKQATQKDFLEALREAFVAQIKKVNPAQEEDPEEEAIKVEVQPPAYQIARRKHAHG